MPAAIPVLGLLNILQSDKGVMHQRSGLKCLARFLSRHFRRGQVMRFVNKRSFFARISETIFPKVPNDPVV